MSRLVAFPLKDGGAVVVEVDEATDGPVRAARPGDVVVEIAKKTFDEAASGLRAIAEKVIGQVRDLGPETIEVEFSIKFNAEAGMVLAKASSEGACKVKLAWKASSTA
jgi:hypothetical protein